MKKRKVNFLPALALGVLAVAGLYLAYQIWAISNPGYLTETAIAYEMEQTVELTAAAVFDKQTVEGSGMLGYLVEEGERVRPGQLVAEIYSSPEQSQAQSQYRQLQEQIELLKSSDNVEGSDVGTLSQMQQNGLYALLNDLAAGDYTAAPADFDQYLLAANKIQRLTGRTESFVERITQLQVQMDALVAAIGSPTTIAAPVGGYFVSARQAGIQPYTAEELDAMTAGQLADALAQAPTATITGVGEIVTDYRWSLYAAAPTEQLRGLRTGQQLTLRLPERGGAELPVTVEELKADSDSGLTKIRLSCENISAEVLGLGVEQVELILNQYEGIRVPKNAAHIRTVTNEDGSTTEEYGVYVRLNNLIYFRRITNVLYETDEYMLLPLEGELGSEDEVRVYDEIIVEGMDLEHGKLI